MKITYEYCKGFEDALEIVDNLMQIAHIDEQARKSIKNMASAIDRELTLIESGENE